MDIEHILKEHKDILNGSHPLSTGNHYKDSEIYLKEKLKEIKEDHNSLITKLHTKNVELVGKYANSVDKRDELLDKYLELKENTLDPHPLIISDDQIKWLKEIAIKPQK